MWLLWLPLLSSDVHEEVEAKHIESTVNSILVWG